MAVFGLLGIAVLSLGACDDSSDLLQMDFQLVLGRGDGPSGWIAAEGVITADTPDRFSEFLTKECNEKGICDLHKAGIITVGFHSKGGDLLAGMELGRMIRNMHLNTALARMVSNDDPAYSVDPWTEGWDGGQCESACAYAFFGGVSRQLTLFNADRLMNGPSKRGSLGVHQYYDGRGFASGEIGPKLERQAEKLRLIDETAKTQYYSGLIIDHLESMGINSDILLKSSKTHKGEMLYLEKNELLAANAITIDILIWRRDGKSTPQLLFGFQTPQDTTPDISANVFCLKNDDESYSVAMVLWFKPHVVMKAAKSDALAEFGNSLGQQEVERAEYNGFALSYGDSVAITHNLSMRFDVRQGGGAEMRFDAKLDHWQHIYENANGILTLEPIGRLAGRLLRLKRVNIFLDDVFWRAFSDLSEGKLGCSKRRKYSDVSATRSMETEYQKIRTSPFQPEKETHVIQKVAQLEFLEQIFFEEGASALSRNAQKKLDNLARRIAKVSGVNILLQGRTANREGEFATRETTLRLGADRNTAVASYLMRQGVKLSQIAAVSYGRERPIVDKTKEDTEAENRTVMIVLR
ncbi:OmpA family protein [uncultured Sneathiella sp.]|uniref:OmpA family protein n=1 Tax=uncultured Sneathiella sp. TaxID=879315 RepID=UPI0030EE4713|tara:strand:- start:883 stop:2622 length:1740 start_codon:yes stop_codon:yes gene_type:complete